MNLTGKMGGLNILCIVVIHIVGTIMVIQIDSACSKLVRGHFNLSVAFVVFFWIIFIAIFVVLKDVISSFIRSLRRTTPI